MKIGKFVKDIWAWLKQCPIFKKPSFTSPSTTPIEQNMHKDDVRRPMSEKELFDRTLNEQYGPAGDGPEWPHERM